jgi:hypothetical protein
MLLLSEPLKFLVIRATDCIQARILCCIIIFEQCKGPPAQINSMRAARFSSTVHDGEKDPRP